MQPDKQEPRELHYIIESLQTAATKPKQALPNALLSRTATASKSHVPFKFQHRLRSHSILTYHICPRSCTIASLCQVSTVVYMYQGEEGEEASFQGMDNLNITKWKGRELMPMARAQKQRFLKYRSVLMTFDCA